MEHKILNIFTDGGVKTNPGRGAWAAVIKNKGGNLIENIGSAVPRTTNNLVEYKAIYEGVDRGVQHYKASFINMFSDSKLAVSQLKGLYKVESPALNAIANRVNNLINEFQVHITFNYIPREQNKEAHNVVQTLMKEYDKG